MIQINTLQLRVDIPTFIYLHGQIRNLSFLEYTLWLCKTGAHFKRAGSVSSYSDSILYAALSLINYGK